MPDDFDPYFKWLGIPPEEQPPNHYRLLAIPPFVDDPDVIETAADQRMMILRSYQTGKRASYSQEILNEVSEAKVCLLNPERKVAYDAELRASMAATVEPPPEPRPVEQIPREPVASPPTEPLPQISASRTTPTSRVKHRPTKATPSWLVPTVVGCGVVLALVVFLALNGGGDDPAPEPTYTGEVGSVNEGTAKSGPTFKFRPANDKEVIPGTEVRFRAVAEGMTGETEGTLYRLTSAPPRAKIDPASGLFHWQSHQEDAGRSYEVQLSAVSSSNEVAELAFAIDVRKRDVDKSVDVLSLVNLSQGAQWIKDGEGLKSKNLAHNRHDIPFSMSGSYDVYIVFRKLNGKDGPLIGVPVGDRFTTVMIQAWPLDGGYSYLLLVDGLKPRDNPRSARGIVLNNGQDYTLKIEVRQLSAGRGKVRTLLDDKELFVWQGQISSLDDWGGRTTLFLATNWAPHLFKDVRVRPVKN